MKLRVQMEALIDLMLEGQILLGEAMSEFERLYIEKCLARNGGRIADSAQILGIHRNTVSKRLANYAEQDKRISKPTIRKSVIRKTTR